MEIVRYIVLGLYVIVCVALIILAIFMIIFLKHKINKMKKI